MRPQVIRRGDGRTIHWPPRVGGPSAAITGRSPRRPPQPPTPWNSLHSLCGAIGGKPAVWGHADDGGHCMSLQHEGGAREVVGRKVRKALEVHVCKGHGSIA